jgi:predicted RNA-binding protein YlqC (UPF0109 family)
VKDFIEYIAKQLVDHPDKVIVEEKTPDKNTIELLLKVDKTDIGKVIGKHGYNVNAIQTLLSALGGREHQKATLEVFDPELKAKK